MKTSRLFEGGASRIWLGVFGAMLLAFVSVQIVTAAPTSIKASADNQYVGSDKCKSCHEAESSGNQYGKWLKAKHSKAIPTLSSPDSLALGAKVGVTSPATDAKCLSCHQTGYGEPADHFAKTFDPKQGVQCESCHGPGQKHVKARLAATDTSGGDGFGFEEPGAAAVAALPAGEIIRDAGQKHCTECHNSESPSFKSFDYTERHQKIAHPDPRKAKTP